MTAFSKYSAISLILAIFAGAARFAVAQDDSTAAGTAQADETTPAAAGQPADAQQAEDATGDNGGDDMTVTNETSTGGNVSNPLNPPPSGRDARSRRFRRRGNQTNNNYSSRTGQNGSSTNGSPFDFSAFSLITQRNIFDPNRFPNRTFVPSGPRRSYETFSLVGIMSYDKGTFAFFDGSNYQYQKVLKPGDAVAGFKLTQVSPSAVKLSQGTNQVELKIGMQMRREENGPWTQAGVAVAMASNPTSAPAATTTSTTDSVPPGPQSDILKRLMQRREQE
jgi:hypothetical protein